MRVAFYTLGCKVNQYDTQMMREKLERAGHKGVSFDQDADCYIINSCTVTNMSDKKTRQIISRCKKNNPEAILVVCGCYSQIAPEQVAAIDGIDIVLGTANRKNIVEIIQKYLEKKEQLVLTAKLEEEKKLCDEQISKFDEKTRAIVKIEDGCRNFCSYCAIPFARGPIRSKPLIDVESELYALYKSGYQEVVLTGIHLASYGKDLSDISLIDAIKLADKIGFKRIRLGSLEPNIITEKFVEKIEKIPSLMPSFHLSLQSGCDSVLKRMNRHYTTSEYASAVETLRKYYPMCAVTTDIIVGFPGESDEEFESTINFVEKISFAKIHIFPYSPREGTAAAKMKNQIDGILKAKRCKILETSEKKHRSIFQQKHCGKYVPVLFEQQKDGVWEGYTENYLPVFLKSAQDLTDQIINVKIISQSNDGLLSEI